MSRTDGQTARPRPYCCKHLSRTSIMRQARTSTTARKRANSQKAPVRRERRMGIAGTQGLSHLSQSSHSRYAAEGMQPNAHLPDGNRVDWKAGRGGAGGGEAVSGGKRCLLLKHRPHSLQKSNLKTEETLKRSPALQPCSPSALQLCAAQVHPHPHTQSKAGNMQSMQIKSVRVGLFK